MEGIRSWTDKCSSVFGKITCRKAYMRVNYYNLVALTYETHRVCELVWPFRTHEEDIPEGPQGRKVGTARPSLVPVDHLWTAARFRPLKLFCRQFKCLHCSYLPEQARASDSIPGKTGPHGDHLIPLLRPTPWCEPLRMKSIGADLQPVDAGVGGRRR